MSRFLLAFASTHDGIAARRAMRGHCRYTLLPTPRAITASCGIAILVPDEDFPSAAAALHALGLTSAQVAVYRTHTDANGTECYTPAAL